MKDSTHPKKIEERKLIKVETLGNITEFRLEKNNLQVLYVHVKGSPTVTTCIVYHVGSQHEGKGETGLAHMLEHMLFKDTGTVGPTWKVLEEKGAILNATTWLDRTLYYFNLPKEYLDDMLKVEADRMRHVRYVESEFTPERTNVLSEYEMNNSNPETALEWNMVASAFQSHGYKHDTIGFRTDIESYTTDKLKQFYDKFYWPNNATLIIVGDIPKATLVKSVFENFEHIKKQKNKLHVENIQEAPQEGVRRVTLERNTPIRALNLAFKAPSFREREWTALYIALRYLTEGKTSLLYRKLVDSNLATSVSATLVPTKDPFLAFFQVTATKQASYDQIEKILRNEIDTLKRTIIPAKELTGLKIHAQAEELFSRDGTLNIASQLAEFVATGDWKRYETSLAELESITGKEIMYAVQKYFAFSKSTVGTLVSVSQI